MAFENHCPGAIMDYEGFSCHFQNNTDPALFCQGADITQRLYLLAGQLYAASGVSSWCFSPDRKLYVNSFPHQREALLFFELGGCMDYAVEKTAEGIGPLFLTDPLDMIWIVDTVRELPEPLMIVVGPMFNSQSSIRILEEKFRRENVSLALRRKLLEQLKSVPVLSTGIAIQYAKMLHYMIGGQMIQGADIHYQNSGTPVPVQEEELVQDPDRANAAEQLLLENIRQGNINGPFLSQEDFGFLEMDAYGIGDPRREAKNTVLIFIALCARAAAQGGLPRKIAKQTELHYIRRAELCENISQLADLNSTMVQDFTAKVHACRVHPEYSEGVRLCMDYIQTHLTEAFTLRDVAHFAGYTEYYLTKKFHGETGQRLTDYIRHSRIHQAKILLTETDLPLQQISDRLQFSSRHLFSRAFREVTGIPPARFRQNHRKGAPL